MAMATSAVYIATSQEHTPRVRVVLAPHSFDKEGRRVSCCGRVEYAGAVGEELLLVLAELGGIDGWALLRCGVLGVVDDSGINDPALNLKLAFSSDVTCVK
jgi:hypothetical protein